MYMYANGLTFTKRSLRSGKEKEKSSFASFVGEIPHNIAGIKKLFIPSPKNIKKSL